MQELIVEILKKIELDKEYILLCKTNCDFDNRYNFKRKEVEDVLKKINTNFKYVAKEKTFLKEFVFEEFIIRFFIEFQGGIIEFSYLIWKEGQNENYYKGGIDSLVEMIEPHFEQKAQYQTPIATSSNDLKNILSKYFELLNSFKKHFVEAINKNSNSQSSRRL